MRVYNVCFFPHKLSTLNCTVTPVCHWPSNQVWYLNSKDSLARRTSPQGPATEKTRTQANGAQQKHTELKTGEPSPHSAGSQNCANPLRDYSRPLRAEPTVHAKKDSLNCKLIGENSDREYLSVPRTLGNTEAQKTTTPTLQT